jgi:hypothetical protein
MSRKPKDLLRFLRVNLATKVNSISYLYFGLQILESQPRRATSAPLSSCYKTQNNPVTLKQYTLRKHYREPLSWHLDNAEEARGYLVSS